MKKFNLHHIACIKFYIAAFRILVIFYSYNLQTHSSNVPVYNSAIPNSEKLAINFLHTHSFAMNKTKLTCALSLLKLHLLPNTPCDVFIFYRTMPSLDLQMKYSEILGQKVEFVQVEDKYWQLPDAAVDTKGWTAERGFSRDFRLVGHFRLLVPFKFARSLGYRYLLTMDDDAFVTTPIKENLVKVMSQSKLKMTYTALTSTKGFDIALPELVRYFLVSNHITPSPLLFQDCVPPNISGFVTSGNKNEGWKGTVLYANWFIIDVNFWFTDMVQRFVNLTTGTGDHIRHRWNEQAVIGMVRLIFVQPHEEKKIDSFKYIHKRMNTIPRDMCPAFPNCCPEYNPS